MQQSWVSFNTTVSLIISVANSCSQQTLPPQQCSITCNTRPIYTTTTMLLLTQAHSRRIPAKLTTHPITSKDKDHKEHCQWWQRAIERSKASRSKGQSICPHKCWTAFVCLLQMTIRGKADGVQRNGLQWWVWWKKHHPKSLSTCTQEIAAQIFYHADPFRARARTRTSNQPYNAQIQQREHLTTWDVFLLFVGHIAMTATHRTLNKTKDYKQSI